jgi:DNA-binding CsgD family transcriptional regulator
MSVELVARDDELGLLTAFLDSAPAGTAALVLEGEAGIGKSTLWSAGVALARERGMRVLSSRPTEAEQGLAYAGLGDLLEGELDRVLPSLPPPRRRALEVALLLGESSDGVDARAVAVAVRNGLESLAADGPVALAVDDVQWLDPSSEAALAFALRRIADRSVFLLLARRLGERAEASELEHALGTNSIERIRLTPLRLGATQRLLQARLGLSVARPALVRIHEASAGNPFYALEIARSVGTEVDATQPLPIPETLEGLLAARFEELPDATQAALLLVAASGHPSKTLLERVGVGDDVLEPALATNVIEVAGDTVRFTHPLLASALYQSHSPSERRGAHARWAKIDEDPVGLARHLALSAEGPDAEIATTVEKAAAAALGRAAPIVAAELAEHALRLTLAEAAPDLHTRTIAAARAHLAAGDVRRGRSLARDLVDSTSAGEPRAEALALLSDMERAAGSGNERAIALRLEALDQPALSQRLRAELHRWLAETSEMRAASLAEVHARASLELAEQLGDDGLRAAALAVTALIRFNGAHGDGLALAEEAHGLAAAAGTPEHGRVAAFCLAHVLVWSVQTERARVFLKHLYRELSERDELASAEALWYLGRLELLAGDLAAADEYAKRQKEIYLQYALEEADHGPNYLVLMVAAHLGDLDQARELAERSGGLWTRGLVESWDGNPEEAVKYFALGLEADSKTLEPTMRWFEGEYAAALLEVGRIDEAIDLLDKWEQDAERLGRTWALAHVTRCRGLVAAARGDVAEAQALLEDAVQAHTDVEDPFGRARALLALGVVRRRARQKRVAREAIEAAANAFEEIGAAGWAAKARAELGRIGGRTREEGLSPAERRVAALVAQGRTNREVAAELFLGERTVETHLSRVYAKLGVRSRTELARTLTRTP